ncbi:hypothetical protein [Actinospica robiniae]|uniref:hypothetical protein n=1 Tax=Actinospica robiniae TaxID=304901 RepID=UPI00040A82DE|nr:hypothetical protein [Actinospica robiniae]
MFDPMPAEPEDAVPAGYEPEPAEAANTTGKRDGHLLLATFGTPWLMAGAWLEWASHYSGWVTLLIAGGGIIGFCGVLGEEAVAAPFLVGALLGLGAYAYGIVTSHDSIRMLLYLGLWTAACYLVLGAASMAFGPAESPDPGSAAEAPAEPQEPQDRDVQESAG